MGLEKLGLFFLINYFNQLGEVKNHLQLAMKEVLLAVNCSVDIMSESTNSTLFKNKLDFLNLMFEQVQGVLNYSIQAVTPPMNLTKSKLSDPEANKLKEHIVNSIVSAIDDEIENITDTTTEKGKLKVEALSTVRQVLISQKKKIVTQPAFGSELRATTKSKAANS